MADNQLRGAEVQDCPAIRVTQNAGCPSIRVRITGGGETPEAPLSDVNFYDYDGKRVASYTAADFAALTEMPANPSHQGLTAQGWNWSLSDAQAYVATNGKLNIGQQYITDDGKTRLYITIAEDVRMTQSVYWQQTEANGVTVDWGDGSATETAAGTGNCNLSHTYATPGEYVITLDVVNGTAKLGNTTNVPAMAPYNQDNVIYLRRLRRVEIGDKIELSPFCLRTSSIKAITMPRGTVLSQSVLQESVPLGYITIPEGNTAILNNTFNGCRLESVSFPNAITLIGVSSFNGCPLLDTVTIPPALKSIDSSAFSSRIGIYSYILPSGLETIGNYAFNANASVSKFTIPASVTSIGNNAFDGCRGVKEYHFKGTTPPTIGTNVFNSIPADCVIYVPASAVATYQGATNWSTYASQIVGE